MNAKNSFTYSQSANHAKSCKGCVQSTICSTCLYALTFGSPWSGCLLQYPISSEIWHGDGEGQSDHFLTRFDSNGYLLLGIDERFCILGLSCDSPKSPGWLMRLHSNQGWQRVVLRHHAILQERNQEKLGQYKSE